ncbi:MAG: calcium-binding protein [Sphingomonas bacterium]|uniref:M10 family metallopeptidase C-terminal domain-containing protein n=1 Tax=Sphingomonas bacterium TaxID=1895847 RepID=UPI00260E08E7|nr:hypothetical protein [Sphingomonas bacterium]MDB5695077.1 calcium-binding protein [Sphingomonas bacterium]
MAITISQSDADVGVASNGTEEGAPALLVTGSRNRIVVGFSGLRATGSGPAAVLTGTDNYLRFDFGITSSSGPVTVQGSAGADTVFNREANISGEVQLGGGNDYYQSNYAATQGAVRGGDGNDSLTNFFASRDLVYFGDAGDDYLGGGTGADRFDGGADADWLEGSDGADQLTGGAGMDRLNGGTGDDVLSGGVDDDKALFAGDSANYRVTMNGGAGSVVDLDAGDVGGDEGTDTLDGIEILRFRDQEIDLRIAVNELALTTANQAFTNTDPRYGYSAVTLAANGIQFVNTGFIRGTAVEHTVSQGGNLVQATTAALVFAGDNVRIDNRVGATVLGIDTAIGPRGGSYTDAQGFQQVYGYNTQIINAGTIRSLEGTAIEGYPSMSVDNAAGGLIAGALQGISIPNGSLVLTNAGTISGADAGVRAGYMDMVNTGTINGLVESISRFSDISNAGTITGGFMLGGIDRLVNTGTVTGLTKVDVYSVGYGPGFGDTPSYQFASIDNRNRLDGDLRVTGETQFRSATVVPPVFTSVIANSGTITGSIVGDATVATRANDGTTPSASFREEVANSGRIDGNVDLGAGNDLLVTTGSIGGAVRMGAGDDVVRVGGAVGGGIDGGVGTDTLDFSAGSVPGRFDLAGGSVTIGTTSLTYTGFETVIATAGADLVIAGGGSTVIDGANGNDAFVFGAFFDASDRVDGGAGADVLAIQGNYALVLGAASLVGVETLTPLSGSDARFGDAANNRYGYALTSVDATVAAGGKLIVNASQLLTGENFTFDGSAESDGSFFLYAGEGMDLLTGGANADVFFLAEGRFNLGDRFAGGPGADIVVLRGTVTATFAADTFTGIETVTLMSASDNRFFAGGTSNSYAITSHDGNVAANTRMTVNGGALLAGEVMSFDGRAEADGAFRLFGGAAGDTLRGGGGGDLIYGGLGADSLTGGGGADLFRYQATAESTGSARDTIGDFGAGDRIDLSPIDADASTPGDDAFAWIGAAAFTNIAGQLRASVIDGFTTIEADTNGDGTADLSILLPTNPALVAGDFVL